MVGFLQFLDVFVLKNHRLIVLMVARWSPKPKVGVQILLGLPEKMVVLVVFWAPTRQRRANPLGPAREYSLVLRQESVEKGVESQFRIVLSDIEKQLRVG